MAVKKYYAVKRGFKTGVFETWDETLKQVHGYKGAVYKSFTNSNDAWDFLRNEPQRPINQKITSVKKSEEVKQQPVIKKTIIGLEDLVSAIAYTDGSFDNIAKTYSYGAAIIWKGKTYKFSQRFNDPALAALRNVSGELEGAKKAMKFAFDNKIQYLTIYHDYQGIAAWALGSWKANLEATKDYQEFYKQISTKVNINFEWVKGHSGDLGNELADQLAGTATFDLYEGVE